MEKKNNPYRPFERFVFRTPLFPLDKFIRQLSDISSSEESFKALFANKIIQEAIYLASPVLFDELLKYLEHGLPDKKDEQRLQLSLVRYLGRMSTRCTPFGLFAGCSVGILGDHTNIMLKATEQNKRHTRLDMSYLCSLMHAFGETPDLQPHLRYFCNTSAYKLGRQIRYVEYFYVGTKRIHRIAGVEYSDYVDKVLQEASQGQKKSELAAVLVDHEITLEEATEFIDELIDSQLLVSELEPAVTGAEFLLQAIHKLERLYHISASGEVIYHAKETLKQINRLLIGIDQKTIGTTILCYPTISTEIKELKTSFDSKYLFQTDMTKPTETSFIGKPIIDDLLSAIEFLNKITPKPAGETNLSRFRDAFFERYEKREIPLLQVLDNEAGIGYGQGRNAGDINPLIDGLMFPEKRNGSHIMEWNRVQSVLFKKYMDAKATGSYTIELIDRDFDFLPVHWDDLPLTISVMCRLLKDDGQDREIYLKSVGGASAANLLGRFCHADKQIEENVLNITDKEKELNPKVIFAEIAHLPESRTGNVLSRPVLRQYEIPYLAQSGVDTDNQIPASDLMISVRDSSIRLRSKRLDKEVFPRLSSAHNFQLNSMPVYNFLGDLQMQNKRIGVWFNWGALANEQTWLPRVKYGNVILSAARWTIRRQDIDTFINESDDQALLEALRLWREQTNIPQYAVLDDGDNELFIDFGNVLSIRSFFSVVKKRGSFILEEFLFDTKNAVVKGSDGMFTNEVILSFYKENNNI